MLAPNNPLQMRTFYWLYLTIMLAVLVAYLFVVVSWLLLGCVINPNKYLPYSVATVTMLVHAKATYARCALVIYCKGQGMWLKRKSAS